MDNSKIIYQIDSKDKRFSLIAMYHDDVWFCYEIAIGKYNAHDKKYSWQDIERFNFGASHLSKQYGAYIQACQRMFDLSGYNASLIGTKYSVVGLAMVDTKKRVLRTSGSWSQQVNTLEYHDNVFLRDPFGPYDIILDGGQAYKERIDRLFA